MSESERTDWAIVSAAIAVTIALVWTFIWCLRRWRAAQSMEEQRRWRRWYLLSGVVIILWFAHMTWATLDWASHPLNF